MRAVITLGESLVSGGGNVWFETKVLSQTEATMRGGAAGLAPGEEEVLGEGEIVAVAAAPGEGASAAEVAVAAGGSAHTADLHEAEPQFGTERPAPLPSPFTVLFVGANVSDQAELKLKEEFDRLRRALEHEKGKEWWEGRVKFEYDCFANAASIMQKIKTGKPTILHFACHGDSEGVHVASKAQDARGKRSSGSFLTSKALADAILAINREAPLDSRIRLVIANACMSGLLARMLSEGIDFVVGHGDFEVGDENAIVFSETLYGHMGGGSSLFASFLSAVLSSPPYQLLAPRCDPSKFFLVSESLAGRGDAVYAMPQTPQMPNWDIGDLASPDSTFSPYSMVSSSEALRRGDASNPVWNEVIQWLTQRGLEDTAGSLRASGVGSLRSLLNDVEKQDIERMLLTDIQKKALLREITENVGQRLNVSTTAGGAAQATSSDVRMDLSRYLSDASTDPGRDSEPGSDSEAEELRECIACPHVGDPGDFLKHLDELLGEFIRAGSERASWGLSFCSLLLVAFMRVGAKAAGDDFLDADSREKWMECIRGGSQGELFVCFVGCWTCTEARQTSFGTVLGVADTYEYWRGIHLRHHGNRADPLFLAVYAVHRVVEKLLHPNGLNAEAWRDDVVEKWYNSSEPAQGFFESTNTFLAAHVSEYTKALGEAVKIGSYCALLCTSRLAALLLFEHLAESKLQHKADAAGTPPCFAGFRLLVGSSGGVVSAEPSALPSRAALAVALEGLRAVAALPRADLALLEEPIALHAALHLVACGKGEASGLKGPGSDVGGDGDLSSATFGRASGMLGHNEVMPDSELAKLAAEKAAREKKTPSNESEPVWQSLGFDAPRASREEWITFLQELREAGISPKSRDHDLDSRILCGHETNLQTLQRAKRVVRFFVSSPFTDTNQERNGLLGDVLPALEQLGRSLCLEVHMVETRFGLRNWAALSHRTSEICMKQSSRCQNESAGISFVYITGRKYGFCTLPRRIPESVFDRLAPMMNDEERALVLEWYRLDKNCLSQDRMHSVDLVGPQLFDTGGDNPSGCFFVLKDRMEEKQAWESIHHRLQQALQRAARAQFPRECSQEALRNLTNFHFVQRFFISVTEEEVKRGLLWVNHDAQKEKTLVLKRIFGGRVLHPDWVDLQPDGNLDEKKQDLLAGLIAMVPKHVPSLSYTFHGDNVAGIDPSRENHRMNLRQMLDDVARHLAKSLFAAARDLDLIPDSTVHEVQHHLHFALDRAGRFKETHSTQLAIDAAKRYLDHSSGTVMVLHGRSGSGKTFLMSKIVADHIKRVSTQNRCIVVRFLGTSPASSTALALLHSICDQLRRCYGKTEPVPSDFKEIKGYFRNALDWPSADKPLSLFIDSVDQLDDSNAGRQLEWLPMSELPVHVLLVVSTLPDHAEFQCLSQLRRGLGLAEGEESSSMVRVQTISQHTAVLQHLLKRQGRTITDEQMAAVDRAFQNRTDADAAGTPLWLTIVAHVVALWASYDGIAFEIQSSVRGLIIDLFKRLECTHGAYLARAVMGWVTLCRRSGVSEAELAHLASLDDDVLADVYEWWVPPIRTCPPLVIAMLLADLDPYLSRRGDGSGHQLVSWYHRQFWEAAEDYCFAGEGVGDQDTTGFVSRAERHQQLTDYFSGKWADRAKPYSPWLAERVQRPKFFPGETAGDRMVPTQPLVVGGTLTDQAEKRLLNTRRIHERVYHGIRAGDALSAGQDLCSIEYVAAKVAEGEESELLREYGEAVKAFVEAEPEVASALGEFMAFVGRNLDTVRLRVPMAPFQLAAQEPDASGPHRALQQVLKRGRVESGILRLVHWPDRPQHQDPCRLTIREHEGAVRAVAYSPCGRWVASGSQDNTARICSVVTGEVKCTLTGHSAPLCTRWRTRRTASTSSAGRMTRP